MSAEQFIAAVKARDSVRVNEMLEEDPSLVTCRNAEGESPVLTAVYNGAADILQQLLEWGAELDPFEAAAVGDLERLQNLLRVQPSVLERRSHDGFTMLGLAAYFGRTECVRFLLSKGADVNARREGGATPLGEALARGQAEAAEVLRSQGAPE